MYGGGGEDIFVNQTNYLILSINADFLICDWLIYNEVKSSGNDQRAEGFVYLIIYCYKIIFYNIDKLRSISYIAF